VFVTYMSRALLHRPSRPPVQVDSQRSVQFAVPLLGRTKWTKVRLGWVPVLNLLGVSRRRSRTMIDRAASSQEHARYTYRESDKTKTRDHAMLRGSVRVCRSAGLVRVDEKNEQCEKTGLL